MPSRSDALRKSRESTEIGEGAARTVTSAEAGPMAMTRAVSASVVILMSFLQKIRAWCARSFKWPVVALAQRSAARAFYWPQIRLFLACSSDDWSILLPRIGMPDVANYSICRSRTECMTATQTRSPKVVTQTHSRTRET